MHFNSVQITSWRSWLVAALMVATAVIVTACSSSTNGATDTLTADDNAKAQGFELPDQFGATYSFEPGDGKNHVFVFYMGYF